MAIDAPLRYVYIHVCVDDANVDFDDDIHAWMNS